MLRIIGGRRHRGKRLEDVVEPAAADQGDELPRYAAHSVAHFLVADSAATTQPMVDVGIDSPAAAKAGHPLSIWL